MRTTALLLLLVGCGSTEQTRRTFPVEVVVSAPSTPLDSGWTVSELEGAMPLTELRFYEGRVLVGRRWSPVDLLVATAHAHPGHYVPGEAMAELLVPMPVDLSARAPQPWAVADAVTGSYGSARLAFGGEGVRVRGSATKAGRLVRFDTGALVLGGPLTGLRFEHELTRAPGTMRLEVDLGVLLARVDFDQAGALPDGAGVVVLDPGSVAFNGFERGVTDAGSYRFTWQDN
ncbi:MAG: hypothetical protein IAE78_21040 [Myxococcus sp.]|nr:hypothetical protein [Myxococcus sp.]